MSQMSKSSIDTFNPRGTYANHEEPQTSLRDGRNSEISGPVMTDPPVLSTFGNSNDSIGSTRKRGETGSSQKS